MNNRLKVLLLALCFGTPWLVKACSPAPEPYFPPIRRGEFWIKAGWWSHEEIATISQWRWYLIGEKDTKQRRILLVSATSPEPAFALMLIPPEDMMPGRYWLNVEYPNDCDPKKIKLCSYQEYRKSEISTVTIIDEPMPALGISSQSSWKFGSLIYQPVGFGNISIFPSERDQHFGKQMYYELWQGNVKVKRRGLFQSSLPFPNKPNPIMLNTEPCSWSLGLRYNTEYRLKIYTISRDGAIDNVADWQFKTPTLPGVSERDMSNYNQMEKETAEIELQWMNNPRKRRQYESQLKELRQKYSTVSEKYDKGMKALDGKNFMLSELQHDAH